MTGRPEAFRDTSSLYVPKRLALAAGGALYVPKRQCATCRERKALVGGRVRHGQFTCARCLAAKGKS
jgi:hypothetical protein